MPALKQTDYVCTVTWVGVSPNPEGHGDIRSVPRDSLKLGFDGPEDEIRHGGRTRPSCSRVRTQHPKGTEIANVRQLSIVSEEELAGIASRCGVKEIDPAWLGATVVVKGIPDFSHLPPSSRLQGPDGATVVIDMANRPCQLPAREIDIDQPGAGRSFKVAASGRRGVTAWVERPGVLCISDVLRLHIPDQPEWTQLRDARN